MSASLEIKGLVKRFGGLTATDNVNLVVEGNELHAIIGPNGAGKSTLIGQLAGEITPDEGHIFFFGKDITRQSVEQRVHQGLARSYQISQICKDFTAHQNVVMAALAKGQREGTDRPGIWGRLFSGLRHDQALNKAATEALELVGLGNKKETLASVLAHGEHRQLELAMALALGPKILLLDEPLAGMSKAESDVMIQLLLKLKGHYPILLIEHDMDAVFTLADRVSVLVYGAIIASDTPANIRENPKVKTAYLGDETEGAAS
jgi:branched-chain amino acid transport system ATP-binding protein